MRLRDTADRRLPAERQLAETLGVPRRALRDALAVLADHGGIARQVGRGTYVVGSGRDAGPSTDLVETSPVEVMAVRLAVEPELMPLAVAAARPADLDRVEACLSRGGIAESHEEFELWDASLHQALAAATHNRLAVALLTMVNAARDQPYWGSLKRRGFSPARRAIGHREHADVVQAVRNRDGRRAEELMRLHLTRVSARLFGPRVEPD